MVSEADQQRLWFVGEVLKLLVQTFNSLKLYPREHVRCQRAIDAFAGRLRSYLKMHDSLNVQITQDTLLIDESVVYEEPNRGENLAFRLYVDGVRELRIRQDATREEAEALACLLSDALQDPTIDTTNMLWEAGLSNIEYIAINSLAEAFDPADFLSEDAADLLNDMNQDVDRLVGAFSKRHVGSGEQYSFELSDGAAELRRVQDLDEVEEQQRTDEGKDIFEVDQAALDAMRQQTAAWGPDRVLQALVNVGLDSLAMAPQIVQRENVEWLLIESLETAIRSQNLELVAALLERYRGEMSLCEDSHTEELLENAVAWMGERDNAKRLVELVKGQALGGAAAFCRILGFLGDTGVNLAVSTFRESQDKTLREALQDFIAEHASTNPDALLPLVQQDDSEIARSALFIVSKKVAEDEARRRLLNAGREHPDPKIQEYATHLWSTLTEEGRVAGLVSMLDSESRAERVRAVVRILETRLQSGLEDLKRVVSSDEFLGRDSAERKAFIDAISYLGGLRAVGFLEEQANRKIPFFKRKAAKEVREAAAEALREIRRKSRGDGA